MCGGIVIFGIPPMLGISGNPGTCMFVGMELGICMGACMADGEWKDRCMAWGFEYEECSEV